MRRCRAQDRDRNPTTESGTNGFDDAGFKTEVFDNREEYVARLKEIRNANKSSLFNSFAETSDNDTNGVIDQKPAGGGRKDVEYVPLSTYVRSVMDSMYNDNRDVEDNFSDSPSSNSSINPVTKVAGRSRGGAFSGDRDVDDSFLDGEPSGNSSSGTVNRSVTKAKGVSRRGEGVYGGDRDVDDNF